LAAADVDDAPALGLLRLHDADRLARAEKRRGDVDGERLVPVVERDVLGVLVGGDAGVVHQHVEPPEGLDRPLEQRDDRVFFGEIGRQRQRFAAFGFDACRNLVQQLGAARHQHGLRALGSEQLGDAAADAVAGAGDDRDLALELFGHPVLPFSYRSAKASLVPSATNAAIRRASSRIVMH
jgi:hypothetical protein